MKTRISIYWPLAVAVTLAGLAAMQAYGDNTPHVPLAADEVSAELAHAMSYGIIDGKTVRATSAARGASGVEVLQAS